MTISFVSRLRIDCRYYISCFECLISLQISCSTKFIGHILLHSANWLLVDGLLMGTSSLHIFFNVSPKEAIICSLVYGWSQGHRRMSVQSLSQFFFLMRFRWEYSLLLGAGKALIFQRAWLVSDLLMEPIQNGLSLKSTLYYAGKYFYISIIINQYINPALSNPSFFILTQNGRALPRSVFLKYKDQVKKRSQLLFMKEITELKYTRSQEQIFIASALSSVVSTFLTNPVQVAKLNLQYFPLNCKYYPHQSYIKLLMCECSKFSFNGSIKSLKIAIPQVLVTNMVFMQLYENTREALTNYNAMSSIQNTLLSSFFARSVVVTTTIPVESLRIRFSNEVKDTKLNFHGYKITLARDLTYSGLYWTMLETYRNMMTKGQYRSKIFENEGFTWKNLMVNVLPGFVFGMLVSGITTPMDALKTRIQSQGIVKYKIINGILEIYRKEGLLGLFSGVQWRMLKSGLHSSLYVAIYEWYFQRVSFKHTYISGNEQ